MASVVGYIGRADRMKGGLGVTGHGAEVIRAVISWHLDEKPAVVLISAFKRILAYTDSSNSMPLR